MSTLHSILNGIAVLMLTIVLSVAVFRSRPGNLSLQRRTRKIAAALQRSLPRAFSKPSRNCQLRDARSTLSSDMPASSGKGATAAPEWIRSEFERYAKACGGCLEVKTDEFTQEPGPRVPTPTKITNVYAVLRGTDPANAGRIYLVSGHYDSRDSDNNDTKGAAPVAARSPARLRGSTRSGCVHPQCLAIVTDALIRFG